MILLRMFFNFGVEVLEVLEGFEAWFLQSFFTSESWSLSSPSSALLQPSTNSLGRLRFIGVWGWVSDTWQSLIGDTRHNLIGLLVSSLAHARLLMSSLTHALMCDWFLHDTWQIFVGLWVVIAKSSNSTWHLETRSRTQFWSVVWEWVSRTNFYTWLFKWSSWRWWSFQ